MIKKIAILINLLVCQIHGVVFQPVDTTRPVYCTFSNKFQNRIMIENGKVLKVISSDDENLSILMEELSGQAFIFALDPFQKNTTLSVITQNGTVQDVQIAFAERSSEVLILNELEEETEIERPADNFAGMSVINDILSGRIPSEYVPCPVECQKLRPKKGVCLELLSKFQGCNETLHVYRVTNSTKKICELFEYELQSEGCDWVFLESNSIMPKQKKIAILAVRNE